MPAHVATTAAHTSSRLGCSYLCTEEPPPSGRAVAAKLRSHRGHFKKTFPEVRQLILQRHAEYQKQEVSRMRAAFGEEIRRIASDLLTAGNIHRAGGCLL